MTQWTKVLFDGPKRTDDPIPLDVFDIATDAVIQRKQSYLSVLLCTQGKLKNMLDHDWNRTTFTLKIKLISKELNPVSKMPTLEPN